MMQKLEALLSARFADDGKAWERLAPSLSPLLSEVRSLLFVKHDQCPLCGEQKVWLVAAKDRMGLPLSTVVCSGCGLVFSEKYLSPEGTAQYYSKYCNQFKNSGRSAEEMFAARTSSGSYSFKRFEWIKKILGLDLEQVRVVMEVGCNDGCNLYPFYKNGFEVHGCDFDEDRMNAGRAAGLALHSGGAQMLKALSKKADLLIFSHSLEHMPEVDAALKEARELLSQRGRLYIEVPGLKHWNRLQSEKINDDWMTSSNDLLGYLQFEHNYCFEWRTLRRFTARNELRPIASDEFVRSLFEAGEDLELGPDSGEQGRDVHKYLQELEMDWQRNNPFWKRALKQAYRMARSLYV